MNGHEGYSAERREQFFEEDWPTINQMVDLAVATIPSGNVVSEIGAKNVDELVRKLIRIAGVLKQVIADDQAEIMALKACFKAKEH